MLSLVFYNVQNNTIEIYIHSHKFRHTYCQSPTRIDLRCRLCISGCFVIPSYIEVLCWIPCMVGADEKREDGASISFLRSDLHHFCSPVTCIVVWEIKLMAMQLFLRNQSMQWERSRDIWCQMAISATVNIYDTSINLIPYCQCSKANFVLTH